MSMKVKNIYAHDDEWEESKELAQEKGYSLAAIIRALLRKWRQGEIDVKPEDVIVPENAQD